MILTRKRHRQSIRDRSSCGQRNDEGVHEGRGHHIVKVIKLRSGQVGSVVDGCVRTKKSWIVSKYISWRCIYTLCEFTVVLTSRVGVRACSVGAQGNEHIPRVGPTSIYGFIPPCRLFISQNGNLSAKESFPQAGLTKVYVKKFADLFNSVENITTWMMQHLPAASIPEHDKLRMGFVLSKHL